MNTPDSSSNPLPSRGMTLKAQKPDLFYGERSKLETWILQFDRLFHIEGQIENEDKVVLASTYMKGDAEKWVIPIIRRYMDDAITDAGNAILVESWDTFKIRLRQIFSPFKESVIAEQKIQNLKQNKSAADYTTIFEQYAEQIEWDDHALMRMYKQGLKPNVRAELMRTGATINDLEDLKREVIRLDNELYELALEERSFTQTRSNQDQRPPKENRRAQANQGRQRFTPKPKYQGFYQSRGAEPMHLDMLQQGKSKKEFGNRQGNRDRKKNNDCYNCGKPGHFARDCQSKNKVVRHLNVLRAVPIKNEKLEDWDMMDADHEEPTQEQVLIDTSSPEIYGTQRYLQDHPEIIQQAVEHHLGTGHLVPVPTTEFDMTNLYEEMNRMVREPASPPSDSDDEWTAARREELREAYRRENHIANRAPTPHPGERIRGHWDEEMTIHYPEEEALTPEALAIQTPPDSPKLVRQNATLQEYTSTPPQKIGRKRKSKASVHGSHKGLVVDTREGWVDTALREQALRDETIRKSTKTLSPKTTRYLADSRNSLHGILSWLECYDDCCRIHFSSKEAQSYFPSNHRTCRHPWYTCPKDTCASHLHDKRRTKYFEEANQELDVEGNCFHHLWQRCLRADCKKHFEEKIANGYGPSQTFLGSCLAPGISPERTTIAMPENSSPPQ
jgi:hypothetical protein